MVLKYQPHAPEEPMDLWPCLQVYLVVQCVLLAVCVIPLVLLIQQTFSVLRGTTAKEVQPIQSSVQVAHTELCQEVHLLVAVTFVIQDTFAHKMPQSCHRYALTEPIAQPDPINLLLVLRDTIVLLTVPVLYCALEDSIAQEGASSCTNVLMVPIALRVHPARQNAQKVCLVLVSQITPI
jgi:hypothetical protein